MYEYRAQVVRVVDADTIDCDIDLGMFTWIRAGSTDSPGRLRLYGIDAWETRGDERADGLFAKAQLGQLLARFDNQITIRTLKDERGKYGRFLAVVFVAANLNLNSMSPDPPLLQNSVNHWLVENGHAIWQMY